MGEWEMGKVRFQRFLSRTMFILVILVVFCVQAALSTHGTDVSSLTSASAYSCLKDNGFSFTVVRAYKSGGAVDANAVQTIANAWEGGQKNVDAYLFPCVASCDGKKSAAQQIQETHSYLSNSKYGMLWLDIEGTQYWYSDTNKNVQFIQDLITETQALDMTIGIYTSNNSWTPITGSSTKFGNLPLWYPHYENTPNPSYSDWKPFGGWKSPSIKQYKGTTSICGASVDENFY